MAQGRDIGAHRLWLRSMTSEVSTEPFGVGEGGVDRGERGGWAAVVIGHLPAGLETGKAGPVPVPAVERKPNVRRLRPGPLCHHERAQNTAESPRNAPGRRLFAIKIPGKFLIVAHTDYTDLGVARSAWL